MTVRQDVGGSWSSNDNSSWQDKGTEGTSHWASRYDSNQNTIFINDNKN